MGHKYFIVANMREVDTLGRSTCQQCCSRGWSGSRWDRESTSGDPNSGGFEFLVLNTLFHPQSTGENNNIQVPLRIQRANSCESLSTLPAALICAQQMAAILKSLFRGNYRGEEKPVSNFAHDTIIIVSWKCAGLKVCTEHIVYI
jgi:hypothetical protein